MVFVAKQRLVIVGWTFLKEATPLDESISNHTHVPKGGTGKCNDPEGGKIGYGDCSMGTFPRLAGNAGSDEP